MSEALSQTIIKLFCVLQSRSEHWSCPLTTIISTTIVHPRLPTFLFQTMSANDICDAFSVPVPPPTRSLKRSASVASLPTPPRTRSKRSRSRPASSASIHHSSDDESATDVDSAYELHKCRDGHVARVRSKKKASSENNRANGDDVTAPHKRRSASAVSEPGKEEDIEAAFWTGCGASATLPKKDHEAEKQEKASDTERERSFSRSPALLRYRVKAPVSPPPSRRQPQAQPNRASSVDPATAGMAPTTPPRRLFLRVSAPPGAVSPRTPRKSKSRIWPSRDTPSNPFLVDEADSVAAKTTSEWDSTDDEDESKVVNAPLVRKATPTPAPPYEERPTITYVFRGQKATFVNPLYNLSPEVEAASRLPMDHPDYEPLEACAPRRLFTKAPRKDKHFSRPRALTTGAALKCGSPSTEGNKKPAFMGCKDREPVFTKPCSGSRGSSKVERQGDANGVEALSRAREERERKVVATKARLASEGLRAGAVVAERDEPLRRALGPARE